MRLEYLYNWWSENYFLDPLSGLTALVGFIIIIFKKDRKSSLYIFSYYLIAYFVLKLILYTTLILSNKEFYVAMSKIERFADYIFTLFEFFVFFLFFQKTFFNKNYVKALRLICLLFSFIGVSLLLYDSYTIGRPRSVSTHALFNVQAICLLVPCLFYYLEIFKSRPIIDWSHEPSFWVTTGLSLFMTSTLPFSLLLNRLVKSRPDLENYLFDVFYIFYILLFTMIILASLCRPAIKR